MSSGEWAIVNALVMDAKGGFVHQPSVGISAGLFTEFNAERPGRDVLDARGLWLIPGVYDCHTHISWNDFHLEDRDRREPAERARLTAGSVGARVMVHTWGGDSADWAVEAGAASLEHGIYLTQEQVSRAADAGVTLVPTLTIYRHVRDMVLGGRPGRGPP